MPVLGGHSKKQHQKLVFITNYCLMQVKVSQNAPILSTFIKLPLFCLFLSDRLRQILVNLRILLAFQNLQEVN